MKTDNTKTRLAQLKELLVADNINLNTTNLYADPTQFPDSDNTKYIDYIAQREKHKNFAQQVITNIINTYIKSEKLLNSPRLLDLKQMDIINYSRLLLITHISEENLITLQESIDGGDMSPTMFESVNKAQQELRKNMEAIEKHLTKCEKYWASYAANFGLTNEEEEIIQSTNTNNDEQLIIMDMTKLTEIIQDNVKKQHKLEKENKDNEMK